MSDLARTAFYDMHIAAGAKMVPFAGYSMPVQYPLGVLKEHLHTRRRAGLFDVSHMGQVRLRGDGVKEALEALVPVDVIDLPANMQRYGLLTNDEGGIIDDVMISNTGDDLLIVVNAACKHADIAHMRNLLPAPIAVEYLENQALLALQGPQARTVMSRLVPELAALPFMHCRRVTVAGIGCWVSCSGYTGEDGFEISVANTDAMALGDALLQHEEVEWIGLGARDSLRLEAGLCLYGHDIDQQTTPIEAGLLWAISKSRRPGGVRAGGFPGSEIIARQIESGCSRRRLMLQPQGRAPVREGAELVTQDETLVGVVTSGGFGPALEGPVAMAYVEISALEQPLFALVRGKKLPVQIAQKSLLPSRYFRG